MKNVSQLEKLDTQTLKYLLKNAVVEKQEETQADFLKFVKTVWPEFVQGKHHKIYAEKLNRIANGELKSICFLHFLWVDIQNLNSYKLRILGS